LFDIEVRSTKSATPAGAASLIATKSGERLSAKGPLMGHGAVRRRCVSTKARLASNQK